MVGGDLGCLCLVHVVSFENRGDAVAQLAGVAGRCTGERSGDAVHRVGRAHVHVAAIIAATIVPPASTATPARHSLPPLWLARPTCDPAGASRVNRSDEMRRTISSLEILAPTFVRP